MDSVPIEILAYIQTFLSHENWNRCRLVCKKWIKATSHVEIERRKQDYAEAHMEYFDLTRMEPNSFSVILGPSRPAKKELISNIIRSLPRVDFPEIIYSTDHPTCYRFVTYGSHWSSRKDRYFELRGYDAKYPMQIENVHEIIERLPTVTTPTVINDGGGFATGDVDLNEFSEYIKSRGGGFIMSSGSLTTFDKNTADALDYIFLVGVDPRLVSSLWDSGGGNLCFRFRERFKDALSQLDNCVYLVLDIRDKQNPKPFLFKITV